MSKILHEKALSGIGDELSKLLKQLGEVMRERDRLKKENEQLNLRVKDLENESRNVPLCADHAERWFTRRYFEPGECWFCQCGDNPKPEVKVEVTETDDDDLYFGIHPSQR